MYFVSQFISLSLSWDGKHFLLVIIHCNFYDFNFNLPKEILGEHGRSDQVCTAIRFAPRRRWVNLCFQSQFPSHKLMLKA